MHIRTSARDGGGAYLLLDGSRAMTGDLDMASNDVLFANTRLTETETWRVSLYGRTGTTTKAFKVSDMYFGTLYGGTAACKLQPRPNAGNSLTIRSRKTNAPAAWVNQIVLTNHATAPQVGMPNLPAADPANGLSELWVSVGVGPGGEDLVCRGT